jgi:hypothetical protein
MQHPATGGDTDSRQVPARIRAAHSFHELLGALVLGTAIFVASYAFVELLGREDRAGHQTLSFVSVIVGALRACGRLLTDTAERVLAAPVVPLLAVAAGIVSLACLRRYRPCTWPDDLARAFLVPSLVVGASFIVLGHVLPAVLTGVVTGVCLTRLPVLERVVEPPRAGALIVVIPLGLGAILRFHALAEFPAGYAEHAARMHFDLSLVYLEDLSASLRAHSLQPFLGVASDAIVRQQWGLVTVLSAIGFKLFGVTLVVSRLVSAALGTLTIYVAYRLGRALDAFWLGLVFAFLLAVSPWHVTISRYGDLEHVTSPLQLLLSLLFVVVAVQTGRVLHILLAATFTASSWYIYAPNLVVPAIVGAFLVCRAAARPRLAATHLSKIVLGIACFAILSYPALREFSVHGGILGPNVRTGYRASDPIFSDPGERLDMIGEEAGQLLRHASDPWFDTPGAGLGLLQASLLVPGLVLIAFSLARGRYRDLGLIVLIGLSIAAVPAITAPDVSFRRLLPVATLAALVAAFALVRMAEAARAAGVPRNVLTAIACSGALALAATGTFGYFDRTYVGEESGGNASFRALAEVVSGALGKRPVLIVVPRRDNVNDTRFYVEFIGYEQLRHAEHRGMPDDALYWTTTCEDPLPQRPSPAAGSPMIAVHEAVLDPSTPCGPGFIARLSAHYAGTTVVVARAPATG